MEYPKFVKHNDSKYPINTDFRIALKCMKINDDSSISDYERAIAIVVLLFGPKIAIDDKSLELAIKYLQCGKSVETQDSKKDMDFEQDYGYIEASFMSDYHIDVSEVKIHWWKFCNLISGLTDTCALSRVREIRNYNLSELPTAKAKQKMLEAKKSVALVETLTKEEQVELNEFEKLLEEGG